MNRGIGTILLVAALGVVACKKEEPPRQHAQAATTTANLSGAWRLAADRGSRALREGKLEEAEKNLRAALRALEEMAPDHPELGGIHYDLGSVYTEQRRLDAAFDHFVTARALITKHHGEDHPDVHASLHMMAVVLDYRGETSEAEKRFRELLAAAEKRRGPHHLDVAQACSSVALTLSKQGKRDEAKGFYERAAAITQKLGDDEHRAFAVNGLGSIAFQQDRFDEAAGHFAIALGLREKVHGKNHPFVATVLYNYAGVEAARGELERAAKLCGRCVAIRAAALPPDHPWQIEAIERCISINTDLGRTDEVARLRDKLPAEGGDAK